MKQEHLLERGLVFEAYIAHSRIVSPIPIWTIEKKMVHGGLIILREDKVLYIMVFFSSSDYPPEPSGFMVSSVNIIGITISWIENSLCSESISYNVASNCTSVTCTTRRNGATCSNLPIATVCSFSISSAVCGQMGTVSVNNAITVTLRRTLLHLHILFLCHVHDCRFCLQVHEQT